MALEVLVGNLTKKMRKRLGKVGIMKKGTMFCLLLVLILGVSGQANMLVNGDFENPATPLGSWNSTTPIPNWAFGGTYVPNGGWQAGLIGTDVGRVRGLRGARIWGNNTTLYQDFAAAGGVTYVFGVYCHNNAPGDTADGVFNLSAAFYNAAKTELATQVLATYDTATIAPQPLGEWIPIIGSISAPAGTVTGRVILSLANRTVGGLDFDDVSVRKAGAFNPSPADGANVGLDLTELSWINPVVKDPNNDTIMCDVYFEADDGDPNFNSPAVVTGLEADSLVLGDYGITLADDTTYYWRVDCTDPNGGGLIFYEGDIWTFKVADLPPAVDAGDDQVVWLNMEDGDGNPAIATVTVVGTYTDDGKSPIVSAAWSVQGPANIVSQSEPVAGTVVAEVAVNGANPVTLTLNVEDSAGIGSDSLVVTAYADCIDAAVADGEISQADAAGDINRDCKVNMDDFTILAEKWLECLSAKGGCTPMTP